MSIRSWRGWCCLLLIGTSLPLQADWSDWWRTPEQAARDAFERGELEQLQEQAPDAEWQGLAHLRTGDHAAAAAAFEQHLQQLDGSEAAAELNRLRYNQGVNAVQAGRYEQALQHFDDVLGADPEHADAAHNRAIAEQLMALQQSPPQGASPDTDQGSDAEGDSTQTGDDGGDGDQSGSSSSAGGNDDSQADAASADSDDQGEQADAQSSAQNASAESASSPDDASGRAGESGAEEASDDAPAVDMQQRQAESEAARQALAAEAGQGADADAAPDGGVEADEPTPLSEREQASEQLLRRIPDDPSGLLRRRLQQSHRIEYPEVRDAWQAW